MDVIALILACSVYPDDTLVRAMVELASQGNPNFVGDLTTLSTFDETASVADAEKVVRELDRQGGRPVVGLMGLPPAWAKRYGRSRHELYDGCVNLWVGTAVLAGHYDACVTAHAAMFGPTKSPSKEKDRDKDQAAKDHRQKVAPPEAVRLCALRRFGQELGVDGYAESVSRLLPRQRLLFSPVPRGAPEPVSSATDNACRCTDECRSGDVYLTFPEPKRPKPRPAYLPLAPILD
jgi:hypothetical protein